MVDHPVNHYLVLDHKSNELYKGRDPDEANRIAREASVNVNKFNRIRLRTYSPREEGKVMLFEEGWIEGNGGIVNWELELKSGDLEILLECFGKKT